VQKLLVIGVETVVGSNLALALAESFAVRGLHGAGNVSIEGLSTTRCDLIDPEELKHEVKQFGPQWIIHCGVLSASAWDLDGKRIVAQHEPQTVKLLAEQADALGAKLTVVTTDAVFDGPRMFHEETCATTASGFAATHALNVEGMLQSTDALVVRTHAYGWSPVEDNACLAESIWNSWAGGGAVELDSMRHATPILATDLAPLLHRAYQRKLQGLYHMTGAERTGLARFASELASVCDFASPRLRAAQAMDANIQNRETSMNSRRARRALDLPMPLLRDGLARFAEQAHNGWRERLLGSASRLCEAAA